MKAFLIGFAVMTGPPLAWHMRAAARRWDTPDHPSRPENHTTPRPPVAAGARPGLDGSTLPEAHR